MAIVRPCDKCGEDLAAPMYGAGPPGPHKCYIRQVDTRGGYPEPKSQELKCDHCGADVMHGTIRYGLISCWECK